MAADNVLFIGWNRAIAGREKAAVELFRYALGYFAEVRAAGQIASFEPVLLKVHGGDLNGFILIRGEATKLHAVTQSEKFEDLITKVSVNVEGVGVIEGWSGESMMNQVQRYAKAIQ
jgi:hypothetical protein